MKNLKRAARIWSLPLGEVKWRSEYMRLDVETLEMVDGQLDTLSKEELERYTICVAAVAKLDFDTYQEPFLRKHCKDIRKKLHDHDIVEAVLECIARNRK